MKEYYKETIDWSKVKKFDPIEIVRDKGNHKILAYFISKDLDVVRFARSTVEDSEPTSIRHCRPLDKSCITLEIDWSKVPVDTKVILKYDNKFENAHFSHIDDHGRIHTFNNGKTSWTSKSEGTGWLHAHEVELVDDDDVT